MDDLHPLEFDVPGFIRTVSIGAGDGRISSAAAARSASNVLSATEALQEFADRTASLSSNVISTYLGLIPQATQLFAPLWLVEKHPGIASAALDGLINVARFARAGDALQEGVAEARSVVKDMVKGRAPNLLNIVKNDKKSLARKVLVILELIASSHRILAKEVLHQFDLTTAYFMGALCSKQNKICRGPFLRLVTTLLVAGDHDIVWYFSTRGKDVLTNAAIVVYHLAITKQKVKRRKYAVNGEEVDETTAKAEEAALKRKVEASQAIELSECISLIDAIRCNLLTCPNDNTVRAALEPPLINHLANVAAIEVEERTENEKPDESTLSETNRRKLRDISSSLFVQIGLNRNASKPIHLAHALCSVPIALSGTALNFVLDFVQSCPRVASSLMQTGNLLSFQPSASSAWLSRAAVIMSCTKRLSKPISAFLKHQFFERCFKHESPMVQHISMLLLAMLCRLVERDESFSQVASAYLPPLRLVDKMLRKYPGDPTTHSVFASYRCFFAKEFADSNIDAIRVAMETAGDDISVIDDTLRVCLSSSREVALSSIFQKKIISSLIKIAWNPNTSSLKAKKIWRLVEHIIKSTAVFPPQSQHELELWLGVLSSWENRDFCLPHLEQLLQMCWKQPYALFDDVALQASSSSQGNGAPQKNSLLTAAALRKLSKMPSVNGNGASTVVNDFSRYLDHVLTIMASLDFISGRNNTKALVSSRTEPRFSNNLLFSGEQNPGMLLRKSVLHIQRLRKETVNFDFSYLQEVAIVGEFLTCLYGTNRDTPVSELLNIWSSFCAAIADTPEMTPLGADFFSKHLQNIIGPECAHAGLIKGFLRLLCIRYIASAGSKYEGLNSEESVDLLSILLDGSLPVPDRCALLSLLLHNDFWYDLRSKALSISMDLLSGIRRGSERHESEYLLLKSVLSAIQSSEQIDESYARCIIVNVVDNFCQFEGLSSVADKEAWAYPALLVLEALVNHSDAASEVYVVSALNEIGAEKRAMVSSVGIFAWKPFLSILKKIRCMAASTIDVITALDAIVIRTYGDAYLPILTVLVDHWKDCGDTWDFLTRLAVGGAWQKRPAGDRNLQYSDFETAFKLSARVAAKQSPSKAIKSILTYGPPSAEDGFYELWWALVSGLLSKESTGGDVHEFAMDLRKLVVQQLAENEKLMSMIQFGPLHAVKNLLLLSPPPKPQLPHHTDAYEDAKQICDFVHNTFKTVGVSLLRSGNVGGVEYGKSDAENKEPNKLLDMSVILQCVEQMSGSSELAVNLNRLVLHSFGEYSNYFMKIGDRSRKGNPDLQLAASSVLRSFVKIVIKATKCLHKIGIDARSVTALTKLEKVLCSSSFVFAASSCSFDCDVIFAMSTIRQCLKKGDFRRAKGLTDHRGHFFAPLAANVVPVLKKERLQATCFLVVDHRDMPPGSFNCKKTLWNSHSSALPYDPKFVLRVLRLAAEYAVYCHSSAVLDLGLVANNGLLRVALYGIASDDELIRMEAYAALVAFQKAVGPEYGNLRGSAAALYRDRRQMSFMLRVLQDSIEEPLQQVLPIFASWFYHALRILLRPTHGAHNTVMRCLLRDPTMNVSDCEGVHHLLRTTDVNTEVKAVRLLALDIIQDGMWSRLDHLVVRRRRIYESILMLAGSALGPDPSVRDKAVRVLATVPKRFPHGQVSFQLCRMHGFASCIVPQHTDPVELQISHLMLRFDSLTSVAASLPDGNHQDELAISLASSFRLLVNALGSTAESNYTVNDMKRILNCAKAVSRLARWSRELHSFNFRLLTTKIASCIGSASEKETCRSILALIIAQHKSTNVDFSVLVKMWCAIATATPKNIESLFGTGRAMLESFIARVIIHKGQTMSYSEVAHAVFETAKILSSEEFSVWVIVSAVALLCLQPKIPNLVFVISELVPGMVPERADDSLEMSFKSLKEMYAAPLVSELVRFGGSLRRERETALRTSQTVDRKSSLSRPIGTTAYLKSNKRARREQ